MNPSLADTGSDGAINPRRAYSIADWQRDFSAAFGPTQARGVLLAADNDEPDLTPADVDQEVKAMEAHTMKRESNGAGVADWTRVVCSCGFAAPKRFEFESGMYSMLRADEEAHRGQTR